MPAEEFPPYGPGRTARVYDWEEIARRLKKAPGEWKLVAADIPRVHAWFIRTGQKPQFRPAEDWMTRTHGPRTGRVDLWMVYVGVPGARAKALKVLEEAKKR